MVNKPSSNKARLHRHKRVRGKIFGTAARPRLNVFRSNCNIYAQIIDDDAEKTLVSASSLEKDFPQGFSGNRQAAREVGLRVAKKAVAAGISEVVFDRGGYLFHGRVKELADGAREGGLKF